MASPKYNVSDNKGSVTFELDPITLRAYLKSISALSKDVQNEIRENSRRMSQNLADDLRRSSFTAQTPVARRVGLSITTPKDRLPTVKIGGAKKVGFPYKDSVTQKTVRASAGALLYGSEYGQRSGKDRAGRNIGDRFKAPYNKDGYWISPTTEQWGAYLFRQWSEMVTDILKREGLYGG